LVGDGNIHALQENDMTHRSTVLSFAFSMVFCAVFCLLFSSQTAHASAGPIVSHDALIGKWTAAVSPDENAGKAFDDTIEIKGGKFSSQTLAKQGFEAATYEDRPSPIGAAAQFSVTLTNKAGDTAKWTGTATGKNMTGDLTITRKDATPVTYTFQATRP
jgi:hypothetical protein